MRKDEEEEKDEEGETKVIMEGFIVYSHIEI